MPRYALRVEYNGAPFRGWQAQADQPSVQETLERALARLDASVGRIIAAGRTDTGVHATGQVVNADLQKHWDPFRLSEALNAHLKPAPVAITGAVEVPPDWSARFSAVERSYLFRIVCRRAPLTLDAATAWHIRHNLNAEAMREGAAYLIGRHDFTTFRSTMCQANSPVRTLDEISIDERPYPGNGTELRISVRARSFLHNQVRSIVGTLERVGAGRWAPARVGDALAAADRAACGPVAPPHGLCLTNVVYDPPIAFSAPR